MLVQKFFVLMTCIIQICLKFDVFFSFFFYVHRSYQGRTTSSLRGDNWAIYHAQQTTAEKKLVQGEPWENEIEPVVCTIQVLYLMLKKILHKLLPNLPLPPKKNK